MADYILVPLTADGEGRRTVDLDGSLVTIVTRYNYTAACWTMDLLDVEGESLVSGVMLVPGVDLLKPYTALKAAIGTFQIIEKQADDYTDPNKLGTDVKMLWIR